MGPPIVLEVMWVAKAAVYLGTFLEAHHRADYTVYCGGWDVGRIYENRGGPEICAGSGR